MHTLSRRSYPQTLFDASVSRCYGALGLAIGRMASIRLASHRMLVQGLQAASSSR